MMETKLGDMTGKNVRVAFINGTTCEGLLTEIISEYSVWLKIDKWWVAMDHIISIRIVDEVGE